MKFKLTILTLILFQCGFVNSQNEVYEVFALKFGGPWQMKTKQIAVNSPEDGEVSACYMIWLLKGSEERNILVDVGFTDTLKYNRPNFIRPDKVLKPTGIEPDQITDVIITHPHWDHIGGINLFPNARVWMQKLDYEYFVGEAWQKDGFSVGLNKDDVQKIIQVNLEGRLNLVNGDELEIIPGIKVFVGSKHTKESQYVLISSTENEAPIIIASDNIWFYYNLEHLLSIPRFTFDSKGYVNQMKRMKKLVNNHKLIIPGHDLEVMNRFTKIADGVVKIE